MGVSKVIYDGAVLVDLTGDTVTADTLSEGATAHTAGGEAITGTAKLAKSYKVTGGHGTLLGQLVRDGLSLDMSEVTKYDNMFYNDESTQPITLDDSKGWLRNIHMAEYMFGYNNASSIDLSGCVTSGYAADVRYMFTGCKAQTIFLPPAGFRVGAMSDMFNLCSDLEIIHNIETIDTSDCTDIAGAFLWCHKLKALDMSRWDMSGLSGMYSTYRVIEDCETLETITLPDNIQSIAGSANGSTIGYRATEASAALKSITINNSTPPTLTGQFLFGARSDMTTAVKPAKFEAIYVPADAVDTYKAATNWTYWADYIKPIQ